MNNPVNVLNVELHKTISEYDLETGEVGNNIQGYVLFHKQIVIDNLEAETIKNVVVELLEKNYIDFETVKTGTIFEESRISFQTFEDNEGCTMKEQTKYFVDNDLYVEVNQGNISIDEMEQIFTGIEVY